MDFFTRQPMFTSPDLFMSGGRPAMTRRQRPVIASTDYYNPLFGNSFSQKRSPCQRMDCQMERYFQNRQYPKDETYYNAENTHSAGISKENNLRKKQRKTKQNTLSKRKVIENPVLKDNETEEPVDSKLSDLTTNEFEEETIEDSIEPLDTQKNAKIEERSNYENDEEKS